MCLVALCLRLCFRYVAVIGWSSSLFILMPLQWLLLMIHLPIYLVLLIRIYASSLFILSFIYLSIYYLSTIYLWHVFMYLKYYYSSHVNITITVRDLLLIFHTACSQSTRNAIPSSSRFAPIITHCDERIGQRAE